MRDVCGEATHDANSMGRFRFSAKDERGVPSSTLECIYGAKEPSAVSRMMLYRCGK